MEVMIGLSPALAQQLADGDLDQPCPTTQPKLQLTRQNAPPRPHRPPVQAYYRPFSFYYRYFFAALCYYLRHPLIFLRPSA